MTIYVGRWDLLPEEWEGINGLYEKSEDEIKQEIQRQNVLCFDMMDESCDYIGDYSPSEFEEEFNGSHSGALSSGDYFVKFFDGGKSVLCD